ncbi:hypothetical protein [uncultured Lacinutrix sp.]|uniref:hypothetical protein n=1 Tax=uncultured Lacinutrix sp. TaxID=574032 RepID=UPI002635D9CE|nr:hypothetical protein [uncultured Lacinutrix sp.]
MITPQNRIIIVDDDKSELEKLTKAFLSTGVGCRPFEYEIAYNTPLKGIRLAFFDLNLTTSRVDDTGKTEEELITLNSSVFNDLANAINQYISQDNGPYGLIFWTKNKKVISAFKRYMQDVDRGFSSTASPYYIGLLDKSEIDDTNILEKLSAIFNDDKIKFYFDFEEKARIAGASTIDKLHSIIPKDEKWGETDIYFSNLDKIISKIAVNILGYDYAKEKPLKGVYEGLSQLVLKEFLESNSGINASVLMPNLCESTTQKEISFPEKIIASKLNTIFHIEENTDFDSSTRGGVFELNLERLKPDNFNPSYHFSLSGYFKNLESFNADLFFRLKDSVPQIKLDEIKTNIKFIAIEISASCDYSQNKKRNNKFILGLLTPTIGQELFDLKSFSQSLLYKEIPNFYYKEKEYSIFLNLNYVFSDSDSNFINTPLFVLKKEIVDMIGNRYANHVSRIGITSF